MTKEMHDAISNVLADILAEARMRALVSNGSAAAVIDGIVQYCEKHLGEKP